MRTAGLSTIALVAGVALWCTGTAPVAAAPPKADVYSYVLPGTDTAGLEGFCSFAVRLDFVDAQRLDVAERPDGSMLLSLRGAGFVTLTNVETSVSIRLNNSGPREITVAADGSLTGTVAGLRILTATAAGSALLGVPRINYNRGRATFTVSPTGEILSYEPRGPFTDLCAALS